MRLHASSFALSAGTPAVGLYWKESEPKIPGMWANLGLVEFALSHDEMAVDRLLTLCNCVFDNYTEVEATITDGINLRKQYMFNETARLLTDI